MGNKYVENKKLNNAECLTYMLPYLLRDGGYYEKNLDVPPTLEPFTMTMIKDAPRQDNGGDCGVYALKFIEYKSSEENPSFGPQDIMLFRKKYAVDLYFNKLSM
ncbi:putative ubiquitin-like-specific protease 1B [Ziziphus jujuba]|uniref:Ubiquitin-like-specific protease 1B n=1 Tax=Ziziphus jujuba TaxID=326968 RepID=A0ABM4A0A2_ZIZJJ|nr:putative ubiquitin-like-specific protease 1B [Ziziphus jujuba]